MARALKNSRPVGGSVLSSSFPIPGVIPAVSVESSPSQNTTPDEFDYLFNYDLSEGKNSSKLSKRKRDKSPQSQKSSKVCSFLILLRCRIETDVFFPIPSFRLRLLYIAFKTLSKIL